MRFLSELGFFGGNNIVVSYLLRLGTIILALDIVLNIILVNSILEGEYRKPFTLIGLALGRSGIIYLIILVLRKSLS